MSWREEGGGGYPSAVLAGGRGVSEKGGGGGGLSQYCPGWGRGTPFLGYFLPGTGVPLPTPSRDLGSVTGVPFRKNMGPVEVLWDGDGLNPPSHLCGQTHTCENSTFPILRMWAVNISERFLGPFHVMCVNPLDQRNAAGGKFSLLALFSRIFSVEYSQYNCKSFLG